METLLIEVSYMITITYIYPLQWPLCLQHWLLSVLVNKRIEREVNDYEEKYRGRELPGFINYKTFEVMVKEQIKKLEEPAIRKLKEISGILYIQKTCI